MPRTQTTWTKDNHPKGRPKGALDKVTREQRLAARDEFAVLWPVAKSKVVRHLGHHRELEKALDCATCRHYVDMIVQYVFGKPTQPVDVNIPDALRFIAEETGADADAVRSRWEELTRKMQERGWRVAG